MADYVKISCNNITRDAERIKELSNSIPKLMNEMQQAMSRLDACWEGNAWTAFQNSNAYYTEILMEIYRYYGNFTAHLHEASQTYMRAEQDVMDEVDTWSV